MTASTSTGSARSDRKSALREIRKREDEALAAVTKADTALRAVEKRQAQAVARFATAISEAREQLAVAYQGLVDVTGKARAAEYLDVSAAELRAVLACLPDARDGEVEQ